MIALLEWTGARARWILAGGVIAAMLMPALSAWLRPALPLLVVLVFALAMTRMELGTVARAALRPRRLLKLLLWTAALVVVTPTLLWGLAVVLDLPQKMSAALVYTGAAPPITSAASLCLILGLNAVFALELTVLASLATPVLGPAVAAMLLGAAVPIDAVALAARLAAMIGAGAAVALVLRQWLGPERIRRHAGAFDGIAAIAMILFVIPLFDGFWRLAAANPMQTLGLIALVLAANTGMMLGLALILSRVIRKVEAQTAGLVWGNRTVALYLAALPAEPVFTLYVALYQIPMLFTPLIVERVFGRPARSA